MANKIRITVGGIDYIISSEDEETYVRKIGDELNIKLDTLARNNPYLSTAMVAILAALEYCDNAKKKYSGNVNDCNFSCCSCSS